jgi:hypothetical protein
MGSISEWFNNPVQVAETKMIVEDTHAMILEQDEILNEYFPIQEYDDRNFLGMVVEKVTPIASTTAYGGKSPATKWGRLKQVISQLSKIGLDFVFEEEDQWRIETAMRLARANGRMLQATVTADGMVIPGSSESLARYLFGKPEQLTIAVHNLLRLFAWQTITMGSIDYADPRTNIVTQLSWREDGVDYNHFPSALTATGAAADPATVVWTDYQNANGIHAIENGVIAFRETNGFSPDAVVMSELRLRDLMRQIKVVDLARQTLAYTSTNGLSVSLPIINKVLEDRMCPPIVVNDLRYDRENPDGTTSRVRFLDSKRFAFLTKNMGERALGSTIESKEGLYDEPKPGIFIEIKTDPTEPSRDWMKARATGLAICLNPKLLYSQQVAA